MPFRERSSVYIGNANRSRLAVAKQYLDTVAQLDYCSGFIRADKGQETVLLADAQLRIFGNSELLNSTPPSPHHPLFSRQRVCHLTLRFLLYFPDL